VSRRTLVTGIPLRTLYRDIQALCAQIEGEDRLPKR
jgi:predicted DNA-binding transcriptional regulator YafY